MEKGSKDMNCSFLIAKAVIIEFVNFLDDYPVWMLLLEAENALLTSTNTV
jgi:hypothetical protein